MSRRTKTRLVYALLFAAGSGFVLSLVAPVSTLTAQFVGTLCFGLMTGLWLAHLVYNL